MTINKIDWDKQIKNKQIGTDEITDYGITIDDLSPEVIDLINNSSNNQSELFVSNNVIDDDIEVQKFDITNTAMIIPFSLPCNLKFKYIRFYIDSDQSENLLIFAIFDKNGNNVMSSSHILIESKGLKIYQLPELILNQGQYYAYIIANSTSVKIFGVRKGEFNGMIPRLGWYNSGSFYVPASLNFSNIYITDNMRPTWFTLSNWI